MKKSAVCHLSSAILFLVALAGCANYRGTSSVPEELRTVAVPVFENRTSSAELGPIITQYVLREFQREGTFSVIIPYLSMTEFVACCLSEGLHLCRRCVVRTTARKPPRRVLLSFSKCYANSDATCQEEVMCLSSDDGGRSNDYKELTKDFYLW